jgi:hypothetical protein
MNQDELNEHLVDKHQNELCSIDEEEIELVVEPPKSETKRKQTFTTPVPSKKLKVDKQIDQNLEGVSFIEYEEIEPVKSEPKTRSAVKVSQKTQAPQMSRVKMSQSDIDRLKKEGKIIDQDGVLIMKQ